MEETLMNTPTKVIRIDKQTGSRLELSFAGAVSVLAAVMPASRYASRPEIAAHLASGQPIETLWHVYQVEVPHA
jgi:hypothetical protein